MVRSSQRWPREALGLGTGGRVVKIGQSSGSSADIPGSASSGLGGGLDPFEGIENPLNRAPNASGVSWFSANRAVATALAASWFGGHGQATLGEYLDSQAEHDRAAAAVKTHLARNHSHWLDEPVVPSVLAGSQSLGEFVLLSESALGAKVLQVLSERGLNGMSIPVMALGGSIGEIENVEGAAVSWVGPWATEFGSRAFNRCEIYRDEAGTEWCYVFTNLAVATRKPDSMGEAFCRYSSIPRSVLAQLFIAETPLPSSIMSMGRGLAYPDVPEEFYPKPLVSIEDFAVVTYVEGEADQRGQIHHEFVSMPFVVRAGFAFSADAEPYLEAIMTRVFDSVTNLSSIAEDGFRNFRGPEAETPYDFAFGSEYVLEETGLLPGTVPEEGKTTAGWSRFVPEMFLGSLIAATDRAYLAAQHSSGNQEKRALLEWMVSEGAGRSVSAAINTLCYVFLMPEKDWAVAETLLNIAINLDHQDEATNALCNLGQVKYAQGEIEAAEELLKKALDRRDQYAEAEACFHLGVIFEEKGDHSSATTYWERGARVVGTDPGGFAAQCSQKLHGQVSHRPQFCTQCGQGLGADSKFCGKCGSQIEA